MRIVRAGRDIKAQTCAESFGELRGECCLPRTTVRRHVTQRRSHTFAMHTFFASRFALHRQHEANLGGRHDDLAISWEILASWAFVLAHGRQP
jgi:hypothetical protein